MLFRSSAYTKSVDQTYRAMESASVERAEIAAGMLESQYSAQPKEQYDALVKATQKEEVAKLRSELKLTNMKDPSEMRAGDTAHIARPDSPVTQGASFQSLGGAAPDYAPGVGGGRTSIDAFRAATKASHSTRINAVISRPIAPPYKP